MKKHFSLTRLQKVGIASFAVVILALIVLLNVNYSQGLPDASESELVFFESANSSFVDELSVDEKSTSENRTYSKFDPNKISQKEWENLGFSEKQAAAIVKYRSSYGPFKSANDVGKIYVVSAEKLNELKPYMIFEESQQFAVDSVSYIKPIMVDINSATKESLQSINGIGPTFSDRIIKFRDLIGGFYSRDQYKEVYGLMDESLEALKSHTLIDEGAIKKIKINSVEKTDLKKHPYFKKWEVVSAILSERDKAKLNSLQFLLEKNLVNQFELNKMEAYVSYE